MKRYQIGVSVAEGIGAYVYAEEDEKGNWVKYEDVTDAIKAEREACAEVAKKLADDYWDGDSDWIAATIIAKAILARSEK